MKIMQVIEMKNKLEEKIKALEKERSALLEEVKQLREIVELSEKAKNLEHEVDKLKKEAETLKDKIPKEFLEELNELNSSREEEENLECTDWENEELL